MRGRSWGRRCVAALVAVTAFVPMAVSSGNGATASPSVVAGLAASTSLSGEVIVAGVPVAGAEVSVHAGDNHSARVLASTTTDALGRFELFYETPAAGIVYALARGGVPTADTDPETSPVWLSSVVGVSGDRGGVAPFHFSEIVINELTTVGTTYALAQFIDPREPATDTLAVWGPSPGLENAAATALNVIDPVDGGYGDVVTNADNGASNETLATLNTLANLVAACTTAATLVPCESLFALTTAPGSPSPTDTTHAIQSLVLEPLLSRAELHVLAQESTTYQPDLDVPPQAWLLALHYTGSGMGAPGRMVFDTRGNLWTNNNWLPGTTISSPFVTALDPTGKPRLGSPLTGGGVSGSGWGIDIDPEGDIWLANFAGDSISKFAPDGTPLSPDAGWTDGELNHPQGLAVDLYGNVWIANNTGEDPDPAAGSVTVYPGGDPSKALVITGGGIAHPFSVQTDDKGRAWVTNGGAGGTSVTIIEPDFSFADFSPVPLGGMDSPHGLAFDSKGNAWVADFEAGKVALIDANGVTHPGSPFDLGLPLGPWGLAVDGSDRVWVSGFAVPGVWLMCGTNTAACPPGSATGEVLSDVVSGFGSASLQHVTAVQVDPSGNLWAANNWSTLMPPAPGDGLMQFLGIATPVCTPLFGLVERPARGTSTPCTSRAPRTTVTPTTPEAGTTATATPRFTG